jgi:hypothetical protein
MLVAANERLTFCWEVGRMIAQLSSTAAAMTPSIVIFAACTATVIFKLLPREWVEQTPLSRRRRR